MRIHVAAPTLALLIAAAPASLADPAPVAPIQPLSAATTGTEPTVALRMPTQIDLVAVRSAAQTPGMTLQIPLPDAPALDATFTHFEPRAVNAYTALAESADGATLFLAARDNALAADIVTPAGDTYQIRTNPDGSHEIRRMAPEQFAPCGCGDGEPDRLSSLPIDLASLRTARAPARDATPRGASCVEDGSFIDVLVTYTAAAATAEGGTANMLALIDLAVLETNQVLANSNVASTIRLAGAVEVAKTWSTTSSATILDHLRDPTSGTLDEVHALRDQYNADLVTLIIASLDVCGRAYISVAPGPTPQPELGFNIVLRGCTTAPTYAFAHEIGHNCGLHHDRGDAPCDANGTDFAHGHIEPTESFKTIMAQGTIAPNIPHFSSATVLYTGAPTGDAANDNAGTLTVTAPIVARYRNLDCNNNGICDTDDIIAGADDLDANGRLDECEQDLNNNGVVDAFDISSAASADANANAIPDEAEPVRIYVDPAAVGTGLGDSWTDARTDLQTALTIAERSLGAVQEIWVVAGTYTPAPAPLRARHFQLVNNCTIYGGFAGTESSLAERDWRANPTILSGDLLGDDGPDFANHDDNSTSVVWASYTDDTAALDGFFIQGGNCSYVTSDCWFTPYSGGGAIRCWAGDAVIRNCSIERSVANNGGGVFVIHTGSPDFYACDFIGNHAVGEYGSNSGGAAYLSANHNGEFCHVEKCRFFNNVAGGGGAVVNICQDGPFINCLFVGNRALDFRGGGMDNSGSCGSDPTLINCTFAANVGNWGGGGISNGCSMPVLYNCVLWGNHSTFTEENNRIPGQYEQFQHNSWTSCPPEFYNCSVQKWNDQFFGINTNDLDPLFVDHDGADDIPGTIDDDLRLSPLSPAVDSGDNTFLPPSLTTDLDANPRRTDDPDTLDTGLPGADAPYVDRGAYERQAPPPPACPGDIDGDGDTDVFDFGVFAINFGASGFAPFTDGDLDGDTDVDVFDFGTFAIDFGCSP